MRNAFVVLVSLCIGVTSRFIVPSTVTENPISSVMPIVKETDIPLKLNSTSTTQTHGGELPNNRTDESALYEHAADKQNNQSERAFIYINQKYKKPSSLHNYFRIGHNVGELPPSYQQQPKPQAIIIQRYNEPCKSHPAPVNSYFQGDYFPARSQDLPSYFGASSLFNCNNEPLNYNYRGNQRRIEGYMPYHKITNDPRDYIELLKSPILRSSGRPRPKYDGMPPSYSSHVSYNDFLKYERANKQHNTKANILVHERKNEPRRNYGFNTAYIPQNAYQNKVMHRVEEPHFHGDFVNDEEAAHVASIEKAQDEDKLLDQYLKETLEDQVTSKEKPVVTNECRYRDCNLHTTKTSSSVGRPKVNKNPECKCGQRLKEATIPRDRPEREGNKRNQTSKIYQPSQPSDINYYQAIMSEDSSNKRGHELITKLNNTLYH